MEDLGFDVTKSISWFQEITKTPFTLIKVDNRHSKQFAEELGVYVRRCYVSDQVILERAHSLGLPAEEIIAANLPDLGSVMSGDFGEILVLLYQAAQLSPLKAITPKKWRLKQDRTKAAPGSDIVQFVLPSWPKTSAKDRVLCTEVKAKATNGASTPIEDAIRDSKKDQTSRLAKTLLWLKERAIMEDLGTVKISHLDRFIKTDEHPPAERYFRAVAVISSDLSKDELKHAPSEPVDGCEVVIITVPELKKIYEQVFESAGNAEDLA